MRKIFSVGPVIVLAVVVWLAALGQTNAQAVRATFAAGSGHSLSIHADGTLWASGDNTYGQLGTGNTTNQKTWVQVGTAANWVQVAASASFSLGLRADGTLWAWGNNRYGQLGSTADNGVNAPHATPTQVPGTYVQVAAGGFHALGLQADGVVYAWGDNSYGQLGNPTNAGVFMANPTPTAVTGAGAYVQVTAGTYHSLGLRADGTLWAWGQNTQGQLGVSASSGSGLANPTPAQAAGGSYTQVAANGSHTLALRADGTLWAWGLNANGQLGNTTNLNTYNPNPTPTQVAGTYAQVAAGNTFSLALRADGTLWGWGQNNNGQLGIGVMSGLPRTTPAQVAGTYVQVGGGGSHGLGLRADGGLWAWGYNDTGQLGAGTTTTSPAPTVTGTTLPTRSTAMGSNFGLALRSDGTLWAWGDNSSGQLGLPTTTAGTLVPTQVGTATDWVQVAAGAAHGLGLKADGTLWAWGSNQYGQLGNPTNSGTPTPTAPVQVPGSYVQVLAGQDYSLALRGDGTLWAWGSNQYGQLGSAANAGTTAANATPAQVAGTYTQVAAGAAHGLGLRGDGTLWAWGSNQYGQLGAATNAGTTAANATPAQVAGTYVSLAAGTAHSLALQANGTLWAWGSNQYGQLGSAANAGTTAANATPAQVAGTYTQVAAGAAHSLALRGDGTLWAWGSNQYGQLGNLASSGTTTPTASPTQEATSATNWTWLAAGPLADFSLARTPAGTNFASTGLNGAGQLGDGTTTNASRFDRLSPLSSLQPLPVELVSFEAQRTGPATVQLSWATASETNNEGFRVERSVDGKHFGVVGMLPGLGTSATGREYGFTDEAAAVALYYRLAQLDYTGQVTYSAVRYVAASAAAPLALLLAPNPTHGQVQVLGVPAGTTCTVYDALGRPVGPATPATRLEVSSLPAGVYTVRAVAPGLGPQVARLVVE